MASSGPGTGGVTPRTEGKNGSSSLKKSDHQKPTRAGTLMQTYLSKGSNSPTGSKGTHPIPSPTVLNEKQANVQEQGTGRRRPVQEMGSTVDNSR